MQPLKSLYENEVWVDFVMIGMHEGELTKNSKVLPKNKINFNLTLLLQIAKAANVTNYSLFDFTCDLHMPCCNVHVHVAVVTMKQCFQ